MATYAEAVYIMPSMRRYISPDRPKILSNAYAANQDITFSSRYTLAVKTSIQCFT